MLLLPSSRSGPRTSRPRGHSSKKKSPAARPGIRRAGRRLHPRERPAPPRARGKTHEEGGRGHLSSAEFSERAIGRRQRPKKPSARTSVAPAGDVAAPLLAKRTPYLPTPRPFQQKEIAGSPARNSPRRPAPAPPRAPGSASRARENARRRRPRSPFISRIQ